MLTSQIFFYSRLGLINLFIKAIITANGVVFEIKPQIANIQGG